MPAPTSPPPVGCTRCRICGKRADTYAAFIADIAETVTRAALIETTPPDDTGRAEVIPLHR